ncbi:MAG: SDR family oxidoreductase [Acidimicrobiia bacterium]|nr:SDR family oxidoreductase [Acidimicrobiia bacterium]MBP8180214.1 SDR family oxidoreductase [Acidimicrobiia bacterium]
MLRVSHSEAADHTWDFAAPDSLSRALDLASATQRIDCVVYVAAKTVNSPSSRRLSEAARLSLAQHLSAAADLTAWLSDNPSISVAWISSIGATAGKRGASSYSALKAFNEECAFLAAQSRLPDAFSVVFRLGLLNGGQAKSLPKRSQQSVLARSLTQVPVPAEEVAENIARITGHPANLNGQVIAIDGGFEAIRNSGSSSYVFGTERAAQTSEAG